MRCAILADIHANLTAFQAVLQHAEQRGGVDELWCLGDVVGYGPDPGECVQLLRQWRHLCIAGNHDWAAVGNLDTAYFNQEAAAASHWTAKQLNPDDIDFLRNLPQTLVRDDFTLAHGSPRDPIWEYVLSTQIATTNFTCFDTRFCLIGHSHVPLIFALAENNLCQLRQLPGELSFKHEKDRLIINCGGVGQPRDADPRASYAIFDTQTEVLHHYRVEYDISAVQQRMLKAGLPGRLAERLSFGW